MLQLKHKNSDLIIGISLLIFSLFCYFVLIPNQVCINENEANIIQADFFPKIGFGSLAGLSFLLCISSSINMKKSTDAQQYTAAKPKSNYLRVFSSIAIIGVYILTIHYIGYFISTTLVLICLMLNFGVRGLLKIAALSLITTVLIYFIFFKLMMIPLP